MTRFLILHCRSHYMLYISKVYVTELKKFSISADDSSGNCIPDSPNSKLEKSLVISSQDWIVECLISRVSEFVS